jgi:hypothetical protein
MLAALALGSFVLETREPFASLDPSPFENLVHLALAALLVYAGFVRSDPWRSRLAIAITGLFALFAAVMGFVGVVPVPGILAGEHLTWGYPHRAFHLTAAAICVGTVLATRPREAAPPD